MQCRPKHSERFGDNANDEKRGDLPKHSRLIMMQNRGAMLYTAITLLTSLVRARDT